MGLIHSRLTARRFIVEGELHDGFRELYRDGLNDHAFVEPPNVERGEVEGWTHISDMMNSDFSDFNQWYVGEWLLFSLRIDKRTLPAAKFKAELKVRCDQWASEREVERCPASVRSELRDMLEAEWLPRQMPKTAMHEVAWNIHSNMVYISSHSEGVGDRIRKRFYRTFGRALNPVSPLLWVKDASVRDAMLRTQPFVMRGSK